MKAWDFFDEVYRGYISEFDMLNIVEDITDNFDELKLNLLCKEFDFYFFMKRDEFLGSFTHEEIESKMHELEKSGKKVPVMSDESYNSRDRRGVKEFFKKKKIAFKKKIALDVEKIMDPHGVEFFSLLRLRNILVNLKRKHTDAVYKFDDSMPQKNNIQPIHWLNGEESLKQFIEELKSAGLIENSETVEIIQKHFRQSNNNPQPIRWCKTNRLIIYLFNKLSEFELIDTMDRQFQLITEHFLDKNNNPFKRDSIKQDSQNMKYSADPKGSKIVDTIINKLIA